MTNKTIETIMEEQKINEKESIELIATMISRIRNRLYEGYGRVFLLWSVGSACTVIYAGKMILPKCMLFAIIVGILEKFVIFVV